MGTTSALIGNCWRGLLVGLVLVTLSAASGQASSLLVGENYQESSNVTSTAPPAPGACNGVFCYIVFNKVPAGKQLVITQVSCQLSISVSGANVVDMVMQARRPNGSASERFQFLIPGTMPSNQPGYNLVVNSNTFQLYASNDRPEIHIGLTGAAATLGFCSIGGQMVSAP